MLKIEFEPPSISTESCPCCGGRTIRLTRFVSADDAAYAVYYANFSDNHPEKFVSVLISIGIWHIDAPERRCAFYVRIRTEGDHYSVMVCDAEDSPLGRVPHFGRPMSREEALKSPRISEIFHITDHIVAEDKPVIEYLGS